MSAFERFLSLFAPVRPGEGSPTLWLALKAFLLLLSYYLLKPVREALILTEWNWEVRGYLVGAQALLLLLVVPAYGALARRVDRIRLIRWSTIFLILNLWAFAALNAAGARVGMAFFVWLGIFSVLVVSQFWSFAADLHTEESGKRLFAILGVGATAGAWVGSLIAKEAYALVGAVGMMLLATLGLVAAVGLSALAERLGPAQERHPTAAPSGTAPLGKGFTMVLSSTYLRLIAIVVLLLNLVNTNGENILSRMVGERAEIHALGTPSGREWMEAGGASAPEVVGEERATGLRAAVDSEKGSWIGSFFGDFYFWVNLLALGLQLFLVSRLFNWIGVGGALFLLPLIALGGYALVVFMPVFGILRAIKIVENGTDYSVNNTSRHALFLPVSREAKYAAKPAIDTFCHRLGDLIYAGVVYVGVRASLSVQGFAIINLVLVGLWLWAVYAIWRRQQVTPKPTSVAEV